MDGRYETGVFPIYLANIHLFQIHTEQNIFKMFKFKKSLLHTNVRLSDKGTCTWKPGGQNSDGQWVIMDLIK